MSLDFLFENVLVGGWGHSKGTKETSHLSLIYRNYESRLPQGEVEVG